MVGGKEPALRFSKKNRNNGCKKTAILLISQSRYRKTLFKTIRKQKTKINNYIRQKGPGGLSIRLNEPLD